MSVCRRGCACERARTSQLNRHMRAESRARIRRASTGKFSCWFRSRGRAEPPSDRTYTDKNAVEVQRLPPTLLPPSSQNLPQAPGAVDPQDVDVILAAESLDECEVDLQSHVLHVVLVRGQDAQNHVIRVSANESRSFRTGRSPVFCPPPAESRGHVLLTR